jgi:hypothetical protein
MTAITLHESKRLLDLEAVIKTGQQTFVEVGLALAEIRDSRLYKADFETFESYCREKWQFSKQHVYRMIECAPIGKSSPQVTSLNQARAVAKVPAEKRAEVISKASEKAASKGRSMTAQDIIDVQSEDRPHVIAESLPKSSAQVANETFKALAKDMPIPEDPHLDALIQAWEDAPKKSKEAFRKYIS